MLKHILQAFFIALLFSACANAPQEATSKVKVVATTGMVADLARNIGQDSVIVEALMGPGVDPHLYKATQGDLRDLQEADIIFYNGLRLEGKMGEVFEKLGQVKTVVPVAENIAPESLLADPAYEGAPDPHIWFDVEMWAMTIETVLETLVEHDPNNADYYRKNAEAYQAQLQELDAFVVEQMQRIPADKRILITAHDAFNYFGRAYDIEVRGLQGIST